MTWLQRALSILRTGGPLTLVARIGGKVARETAECVAALRQARAYARSVHLLEPAPLTLPKFDDPLVSIIIPVFGNDRFTYTCLHSIAQHANEGVSFEVIAVDDGSPGQKTREMLAAISGLRALHNENNEGYIRSCNRGAAAARGSHLLFLNNDTIVHRGWLSALVRRIESDSSIGAVGPMLQYPDGSVAEAGAIIWSDGSGWNYGRGGNPSNAAFRYCREVDYCSAAALLVPRDAFMSIGGFDERYSPGYYEDADLCFSLRSRGLKTFYEPKSTITHFEGATAGTSLTNGMKRFQAINRSQFEAKWQAALTHHESPGPAAVERAARRLCGTPRILVIDSFVPFTDRDAGSARIARIMQILRNAGCYVAFLSAEGGSYEPYAGALREAGIELLEGASPDALIAHHAPLLDTVWLCRPEVAARFLPVARRNGIRHVVYDTVDLHFVRLEREQAVTRKNTRWEDERARELALAAQADVTVVTSPVEAERLAQYDITKVAVVPVIEPLRSVGTPFESRAGLLFVGNFTHAPNVDAALYLCTAIAPLTADHVAQIVLAGNEPPPQIMALQSPRVRVTGRVPDLQPYFNAARLVVAPLRFGAGLKGKVVEAFANGVPVITTSIGAEGIEAPAGAMAVADDATTFAEAIVAYYTDRQLWVAAAGAARAAAERYTPERVRKDIDAVLGLLT